MRMIEFLNLVAHILVSPFKTRAPPPLHVAIMREPSASSVILLASAAVPAQGLL